MQRTSRQNVLYTISILLAAAPFAVAMFRALGAQRDLRFLWMAAAALLGAMLVRLVGTRRFQRPNVLLVFSVLVAATVFAAATAVLLGTSAAPGIFAVALAFGLSFAAGYVFDALSRAAR
ncbi:MAG: hypothetical protein ACT4P6_12600 [Gemmatimonadaceae bacterium]